MSNRRISSTAKAEPPQFSPRQTDAIIRKLAEVVQSGVPGDVVEMGCYRGDTSLLLQRALSGSGKRLYLYDSFAGLPLKGPADISPAGQQFKAGALAASRVDLARRFKRAGLRSPVIVKGWFEELDQSKLPLKICFGLLDSDFYSSISASLKLVSDRLAPGGCLVVDDYQSEALPGVARAVDEWLAIRPPAGFRVVLGMAVISV